MKTVLDVIKHYLFKSSDERYDHLSRGNNVSYKTITVEDAWHDGKPEVVIYLATCAGILSSEQLRLFALWSVISLNELAVDPSCRKAIETCREYYENPNPSKLATSLDLISSPSHTINYVKKIPPHLQTLDISLFHLAEFSHKTWRRSSQMEDQLCGAVQKALEVLSEAHIKETGFTTKRRIGAPQTIANIDNFLLGMAQTAWLAAHCARETLGYAAEESHMRSCKSEEDEENAEMEFGKAVKSAEAAQANWLKENASPNFNITGRIDASTGDEEYSHINRSYLSIPIEERNKNYKVEELAEHHRRSSHSERNAEGNLTADELYKRLKFHSPWIEYAEWSSQISKIYEVLEFLEQFPVGDIRIILPTMPPIIFGVNFKGPLSQLDIKDIKVELNADVLPDGTQAMFNLEDYKQ